MTVLIDVRLRLKYPHVAKCHATLHFNRTNFKVWLACYDCFFFFCEIYSFDIWPCTVVVVRSEKNNKKKKLPMSCVFS